MTIEWVIGLLFAGIASLFGFYVKHILDCNTRDRRQQNEYSALATQLAVLTAGQSRIERDIGDSDSGLRGAVHDIRNELLRRSK